MFLLAFAGALYGPFTQQRHHFLGFRGSNIVNKLSLYKSIGIVASVSGFRLKEGLGLLFVRVFSSVLWLFWVELVFLVPG